ncbi:MAG: hypothetical protein PHV39_05135 [Methanomicrobium sp.]|nr:hypothetical protein [Methanomicrobium sp.]
MLYEYLFLQSLLFTWIIEIPLLYLSVHYGLKKKTPAEDIIAAGLLMTAVTLPYLWFVMPPFLDMSWYPLNGEIIIIFIESLIICYMLKLRYIHSLIIAALVNTASYALGLLI